MIAYRDSYKKSWPHDDEKTTATIHGVVRFFASNRMYVLFHPSCGWSAFLLESGVD